MIAPIDADLATHKSAVLVRLAPYDAENAARAHILLRPFARGAALSTGGGLFTVPRDGGALSLRALTTDADLRRIDNALTEFGYGLEF